MEQANQVKAKVEALIQNPNPLQSNIQVDIDYSDDHNVSQDFA